LIRERFTNGDSVHPAVKVTGLICIDASEDFVLRRQIEKRDFGGFDISGCKTVATDGRAMTFDGPKNFVERRDCSFGIYMTEVLQDNSRSVPWCNLKIWQRSNLEIVF
jgi:hypothetical protein